VRGLLGDQIINPLPDQKLASGATWGHWGRNAAGSSVINYKGIVAGAYSKTSTTGMYTSDQVGASVGYTLTLPAGKHTIAAGSYSWWASNSRTANVSLTYDGQTHPVGTVTLDAANPSQVLSYDIELAAEGAVTLSLTATNAQSPMLSWVAATGEALPAPLTTAVVSRCVAGKVVLAVTVTNPRAEVATVEVASPYGTKSAVVVDAGATKAVSFTTRLASAPAGVVSVTDAADAAFTAKTCG
jgi:hypothetical protein